MGAIISVGINKDKLTFNEKGWANITLFVNDETNTYGQNVSAALSQTKEEREAKTPANYVGNGKVVWCDDKIVTAAKVERQVTAGEQSMAGRETPDLPF